MSLEHKVRQIIKRTSVDGDGNSGGISADRILSGGAIGGHLGASITAGTGSTDAGTFSWSALVANGLPITKAPRGSRVLSAHPGQSAVYIATQMEPLSDCDYIIVGPDIGTNGSGIGGAVITHEAWVDAIESIISTAKGWGVPLVFCLTAPAGPSVEPQAHIEIRRRNTYLLLNVAKRGCKVIDTHSPLVDRATGLLAAAYWTAEAQEVHPNNAGHAVIAALVIPVISAMLPDVPAPIGVAGVAGTPPLGLLGNPLMLGTSGSLPTVWTLGATTGTWTGTTLSLVNPVADADLPQGRWFRIETTCSVTGLRRYQSSTPVDVVSVQPGDKLLICLRAKNAGAGVVTPRLLNPATSLNLLSFAAAGVTSTEYREYYTVPAGVTRVVLLLEMSGTAGQAMDAYIGMADIINTTRQSIA